MKDDSKPKDDLKPTPLESLFQNPEPVADGMVEAADAADTRTIAAARPVDADRERILAVDAEMVGLIQAAGGRPDAAGEADDSEGRDSEGRDSDGRENEGRDGGLRAGEPAKPYEELVRELEQIVRRLESGDITLDQSMELFARGIELTRRCQSQLDAIEKKITILIESPDGSVTEAPFGENGND